MLGTEKLSILAGGITTARSDSLNGAGVWIINAAGHTTFASERMAEILGTTVSGMLGKPSFDFVYPEDAGHAARYFEAKKAGDIHPFRIRLRRADGSTVRVEVHGTPLHSKSGQFEGIVGTFLRLPEGS